MTHVNNILVIGSINMDVVNRVYNHPLPGETILGKSVAYNPGGKGANQAVAAARAGSHVRMLGAVGNDDFSKKLLDHLVTNHIDISSVKQIDGPTSMAFITVDDEGENSIIVAPGANQTLSKKDMDLDETILRNVDTLILQNEIPIETTLNAMKVAHERGLQVIFNPAPITNMTLQHVENANVVVLNKTEAEALTGATIVYDLKNDQTQEVFRTILTSGPKAVVITMGHLGAIYGTYQKLDPVKGSKNEPYVISKDGVTLIQEDAIKVSVIDTTAAGDTFVGAFASIYKQPSDVFEALRFASAASALAVTKEGAQASVPYKKDVLKFLINN